MPVITLQVGQCGNQLGHAWWQLLSHQCDTKSGWVGGEESVFFRETLREGRQARCLLVDTEPKVVDSVVSGGTASLFARSRCYLGQSGRGNNWAFGYGQVLGGSSRAAPKAQQPSWNFSANVEDPGQEEYRILEHVFEGVRREAEEADTAPDFLLMHSLGGGSGSGLGSRLLEHVRESYPLHHIASVSVAPRTAGDSPMQSLNSVMALSFLQAYADTVLLFSNQEMLEAATKSAAKSEKSANLSDVNVHIAQCVVGALWPLGPSESQGGTSRIRDLVSTVTPDTCLKLVESRTAVLSASPLSPATWQNGCRALQHHLPRCDALDNNRPITTQACMLVARGFPATASPSSAVAPLVQALGGPAAWTWPESEAAAYVGVRACETTLRGLPQQQSAAAAAGGGSGPGGRGGSPCLSLVANRSSTVGLLGNTLERARSICNAGAYMHWYEKYGCGQAAIQEAIEQVSDVVECYRAAHGMPT